MMLECILKQSPSLPDSVMVSVQLRIVYTILNSFVFAIVLVKDNFDYVLP